MNRPLLLDTHIFVWAATDEARLDKSIRSALATADRELYLSAASVWELAIKARIGKLSFPASLERFVSDACQCLRISTLPIGPEDALETSRLPLVHRDPFDRMLVAQARVHNMVLVTQDHALADYEFPRLDR